MGRNNVFRLGVCLAVCVFAGFTFASDEKPDTQEKVSMSGYSFWQFGQIVKGHNGLYGPVDHAWQSGVLAGFSLNVQPNEYLKLVISPEFLLNYPYPQQENLPPSVRPFGVTYINEAFGKFSFGGTEKPLLQAKLGMFTYKYNKEVRNLGDYLFRTGTFPTYVITIFDFPTARLLGLCLSSDAINNFHADVLLTSEAYIFPFFDFSVTGIASYKLLNAIEIGGGVEFARILPVMDSLTSPEISTSQSEKTNKYVTANGDTGFYSFQATKVMTRATIDPKPFFGSPEWLGPEDLKLYGEICWIGVDKNFQALNLPDSNLFAWYNSLNERTPRMVGMNLPAFRMLDVLAAEVEYFPSVLPNNYSHIIKSLSPVPWFDGGFKSYNKEDWNRGFWRWSFYAKKMVIQGFSVTGQIAFDHTRTTFWDGSLNEYESLKKAGHWNWKLKFGYNF